MSCSFTEPPNHNLRENNVKRLFKMKENGQRTVYFLNVVLSSGNHIFRIHDKLLVVDDVGQVFL